MMTDRDALREAVSGLLRGIAHDAPNHGGPWSDFLATRIEAGRAALAQPAEPGLTCGACLHPMHVGFCAARNDGPDGPNSEPCSHFLAHAAEPELDDDHYPGCDGNPCRCAGVTTKPGLDGGVDAPTLTPEEAVEKALLFTFQLSGKDYRKMQSALSETVFIRALGQDGYVLAALAQPADGLDDHYPGCDRNPCRCAGVTVKPGLDVAWARAEAALPEGWGLDVGDSLNHPAGKYEAIAEPQAPHHREEEYACVYADTPAAALIALAEKLEADHEGLIGGSVYGVPGRMDPS